MAEAASRRRSAEWVMLAQVIAAGVAAGFSGDWKGIQAMAAQLDVAGPEGKAGGRSDLDVADLAEKLKARIGLR